MVDWQFHLTTFHYKWVLTCCYSACWTFHIFRLFLYKVTELFLISWTCANLRVMAKPHSLQWKRIFPSWTFGFEPCLWFFFSFSANILIFNFCNLSSWLHLWVEGEQGNYLERKNFDSDLEETQFKNSSGWWLKGLKHFSQSHRCSPCLRYGRQHKYYQINKSQLSE